MTLKEKLEHRIKKQQSGVAKSHIEILLKACAKMQLEWVLEEFKKVKCENCHYKRLSGEINCGMPLELTYCSNFKEK